MRNTQIKNPFSTDFQIDDLEELDIKKIDKEEYDFLTFSIECHKIFMFSLIKITEILSSFDNEKEKLDFIFKSLNHFHIAAYSNIFKSPVENQTLSVNLERLGFIKYKNQDNIDLNIKDVVERGGDILNVLISIIKNKTNEQLKINKCPPEYEKNFYALWFYAVNIYSFNSFYEILKDEKGTIIIDSKKNETRLILSKEYQKIKTLNTISEIRDRNHFNEYNLFANKFKKKNIFLENKINNINVSNGEIISIDIIKTNKIDENEIFDFSKFLKTNKYLEKINLSFYGNVGLLDIFKIIVFIERIVNHQIKNNLERGEKTLGYKIKYQNLIDYINKLSLVDKDIVSKIIDSITESSNQPYFWRKPLYKFNDYIYLSFSLLSAPNIDLLFESIISNAQIKLEEHIKCFKNEIIEGLNIDNGYEFNLINIEDRNFTNNIVYELRDYLLLIEVIVLEKTPIESSEINASLDFISTCLSKLESKVEKLKKENQGKDIVPIVILNCSNFSGLILNGIPIFDKRLLNNYFVTGEFQRARINYNSKKPNAQIYNVFKYYENEDEFNNVFVNFTINPLPIVEILNKLYWKETLALSNPDGMQLYIETCDYIDETENFDAKISHLNTVLNHQYYNSNNDDENKSIDKAIQFYLTDIFNLLAHGKYDFSLNRHEVSRSFQKINIRGFAHLIYYFSNTLNNLNLIKVKNTSTFNPVKINKEKTFQLMDKLIEGNNIIRLSEFSSQVKFTKVEEKQIITLNLEILSTITIKKYTIEEFENYLFSLATIKNFKDKYNLHFEFYSAVSNIISALNFNNNYQIARNLSEEILLISIQEKKTYRGWSILLICYEQQKNIFDASVYGCLYLTAISIEDNLSYYETVDLFFNVLKFSRNIYSKQITESVFKYLKSIKLKEYDEQKVHLSYYLSAFLNIDSHGREFLLTDSFKYFENNIKRILKFKEKGILPWLNYFYNVKRLIEENVIDNKYNVDKFIEILESNVEKEYYLPIKEKHFTNENLKKNYIEAIKKSLNTISFNDFTFENQNLEIDMHNLIKYGIKNDDFESILLSGFIANDTRLIYKNKYYEKNTVVPILNKNDDFEFLDNYFENIKNEIELKENQIYVYIFNSDNDVYYLIITPKKDFSIMKIKNWSLKTMNKWLKNKEDFYYNGNRYFDLNEQEDAYNELIKELSFTELELDSNLEFNEILISTNIELTNYPINLIVNNNDFLASNYKVTNVILFEWYLKNNREYIIEKNFNSSCWAPIEEGDPAINYGYDKLKPILELNDIKTITNINEETINSNINIFFAHGELNGTSFKAIYKSQENFSAIISNGVLFGKGDIAILFVCHSGKMDKNFFSNSVVSLVHEIIELGYKAVIAPCWALEVTIPEFWLDEFMKKFKTGVNLSEAVFYANNELAKYKERDSKAYFVAEGRLAMHLFGNPNIKINPN